MKMTNLVSLFLNLLTHNRTSNNNNTTNKGLSNGDLESAPSPKLLSASSVTNTSAPNGLERPLIVTRSKTVKVLRSGRSRALHSSSPWKKNDATSSAPNNHHQHHVNGYAKSLKNRALNGISSSNREQQCSRSLVNGGSERMRSPAKTSSISSPCKIRSSAYAKHYKSYRRNSSTTRRNLMLSRSPSTPPPSSSSSSPQRNQRSLKFKSTPQNSGRLRLRPSDLKVKGTRTTQHNRRIVRQVNITTRKPKSSPNQSSHPITNGTGLLQPVPPPRSTKSRSTSASSNCSIPTPLSSPKFVRDKEKDAKVQRRSALWVLNCEAEEFLFGETAADKHELELPPSSATTSCPNGGDSPPPKKRRRWRETELSHLLETSPFLESKLRSSSSSNSNSPGDHESNSSESPCRNGQRVNNYLSPSKKRVNIKLKFDQERRKQKYKKISSSTESSPQRGRKNGKVVKSMKTFRRRFEEIAEEKATTNEEESLRDFGASSFINFNCELLSPRSNNSVDKALQLRETLEQVKWTFSFEHPFVDESWYSTFNRRADCIMSYKSFLLPPTISGPPILLPYQLDKSQLRRSRKKLPKNSRKSPRCHASTLAILSSTDVPLVDGSSSAESPSSSPSKPPSIDPPQKSLPPVSALHCAPSDASLEALLISTNTTPHPPPLLSPFTKFVAENSVRITRKRNSSAQDPYQLYQRTQQNSSVGSKRLAASRNQGQQNHAEDVLTAQQYLWDSIQFLSDPYVVSLLAGEDPLLHSSFSPNPSSNNNKCSNNSSSISTRTRHASTKSIGRVPPPKGSPNKGSSSSTSTNNNVVAAMNGKNGVVTTVPRPLRSPPPPNTRSSTKPPMSPTLGYNSKSAVVVVADIIKSHVPHHKKSRGGPLVDEEDELLFVGDRLPPLPLW